MQRWCCRTGWVDFSFLFWMGLWWHNGRNKSRARIVTSIFAHITCKHVVTEWLTTRWRNVPGLKWITSVSLHDFFSARSSALALLLLLPWVSILSHVVSNMQLGVQTQDANTLMVCPTVGWAPSWWTSGKHQSSCCRSRQSVMLV